MSFTLVLNSQNVIGSGNNTYKYDFIKGNFTIPEDSEVMVANVQLPYSFYNITSAYSNNQFKLYFPTASSTNNTYTITIPDGFYTTTSLNFFLQQFCITNGLYLVNLSIQGQNMAVYVTKDGKNLIPTMIPMDGPLANPASQGQAAAPQEVPKSAKPVVEAFRQTVSEPNKVAVGIGSTLTVIEPEIGELQALPDVKLADSKVYLDHIKTIIYVHVSRNALNQ
jgi:hypothetical protein